MPVCGEVPVDAIVLAFRAGAYQHHREATVCVLHKVRDRYAHCKDSKVVYLAMQRTAMNTRAKKDASQHTRLFSTTAVVSCWARVGDLLALWYIIYPNSPDCLMCN